MSIEYKSDGGPDQIEDSIKNLWQKKSQEQGDLIDRKTGLFIDELNRKFPPAVLQRVRLYHFLLGSTTDSTHSPELDLPEGLIQKFIEGL